MRSDEGEFTGALAPARDIAKRSDADRDTNRRLAELDDAPERSPGGTRLAERKGAKLVYRGLHGGVPR